MDGRRRTSRRRSAGARCPQHRCPRYGFQDIVITGSASIVRTLMAHDLVDEFRLIVFPVVLGQGTRLFPDGTEPLNLALASTQILGPAVRLIYTRPEKQ